MTTLPRLDAIAAKDASGKLWLEFTNLNPDEPLDVEADITGAAVRVGVRRDIDCPESG